MIEKSFLLIEKYGPNKKSSKESRLIIIWDKFRGLSQRERNFYVKILLTSMILFLCTYFLTKRLSKNENFVNVNEKPNDNQEPAPVIPRNQKLSDDAISRFELNDDAQEYKYPGNRTVFRSEIAVYVVVNQTADWKIYELAQESLACYCKIFNYTLIQISMDSLPPAIKNSCQRHNDIYFKRHCVTAQIFRHHPQIKWFFFQGADAGIINPQHFLEDYIDDRFEMIWLQAGFNYDIFTDAYLARNSNFSYDFLMSWSKYEWKAPKLYYSNDNGPVHQVFLDKLKPNHPRNETCYFMWLTAKDYYEEQKWVACARSIFNGSTEIGPVKIIPRASHHEWIRNGWFSKGLYSPNDFMLHGWKKHYLKSEKTHVVAPFPFVSTVEFPLRKCTYSKEGLDLWRTKYKPELFVSNAKVRSIIEPKIADVFQRYNEFMGTLNYNPF